jgi:voltage-gated potassium channel
MNPENMLSERQKFLHSMLFEADTKVGRNFNILLIFCIVASVAIVMLDSIRSVREAHGGLLSTLDWIFTVIFSVEYLLRLYSVLSPWGYARSFNGIIDAVSVVPNYLSLLVEGAQYFSIVRVFRVLRVFRFLKLAKHLSEASELISALHASRRRITVFITGVFTLVVIIGSAMYIIEGEENGFTSIPVSIYWAVVTLTTVGYGDISPKTGLGQAFSVLIMILGYGIIAIPTGIVTSELTAGKMAEVSTQACPACCAQDHDVDAVFCKHCGTKLN